MAALPQTLSCRFGYRRVDILPPSASLRDLRPEGEVALVGTQRWRYPALGNLLQRPPSHRSSGIATYYLAALCSGAAALFYQIVWSKTLSLTFGSTTQGAAAVIAGFMIGMGIGARVYGARGFSAGTPGRNYAYLEFGIAVLGLVLSPLLYYLPTLPSGSDFGTVLARYGLAVGVLFLPSALMGATYPALCRAVIATDSDLRDRLGPVYGFNTLGAALGAIVAGFVLIEAVGGRATIWIAATLNITAAILVMRAGSIRRTVAETSPKTPKSLAALGTIPAWLLVVAAGVAGFTTLSYEIIWFRAAKYLIGNSTYAMSIVLAVFLTGLGLGGLLEKRLARRAGLERDLIRVQFAIAVAAIVSAGLLYAAINWTPLREQLSVFSPIMTIREWPVRLGWTLVATIALLVPTTLLMGLSFPILITLVTRTVDRLGTGIGVVYLSSSLGSMLGTIVGAAVLLPTFGTMGGLKFTVAITLLLAIVLAAVSWRARRFNIVGVVGAAAVAIAALVLLPHTLDFQGELEGGTSRVIFSSEGDLATVKVTLADNGIWKGMTIDGYAIGIDRSLPRDITFKQLLLAHMPLVLHPSATSVLNIGLGSATTQASLASYDVWQRIDCLEISRDVVEAARHFDDGRSLDDPRTRLHVVDAMHFLRGKGESYDVIVADGKQNPQYPGNSSLLSREFFASAKSRLAPDGIMVQWIPLGFPPRAFDVMAKTFAAEFERMSVYYFPPEAVILVGGRSAPPMETPAVYPSRFVDDLSPYLIASPEQIVAGWVTDGDGLRSVLSGAAVNSWDHPILEFWPFRDFDPRKAMSDKGRNLELLERAGTKSQRHPTSMSVAPHMTTAAYIRRGFTELYRTGSPAEFANRLDSALVSYPDDPLALGLQDRLRQGPVALLHSGPR